MISGINDENVIGENIMRKVIFVTKALWIGGIETALVNLLNNLDYETYDVTLLVLHAELNLLQHINKNCKILIIDRDDTYSFNKEYKFSKLYHMLEDAKDPSILHRMFLWTKPLIKWLENKLYICYIRSLVKKEYFDTCVIYSDVIAETAIKSINANRYLMFYHHGSMRHVYHDKIAYKKCEKIIAVSENQANELKRFVPRAANKIIVIHNLTDLNSIRKRAVELTEEKFDSQKFHIVTVGRVSYEKGMDLAVLACERLVKNGFKNICWWIVGDGPAMEEIKNLVNKKKVESYVKLVGMKENPYPYMRQANLYVQPSRIESFGLTILEALIIGKKVIATNTWGAKQLLCNRVDGILCDIDDASLANKIKELLEKQQFNVHSNIFEIEKMCIEKNKQALRIIKKIL